MTLVGKKLQDIYDSGAKALDESQKQAIKNFEQEGTDHLKTTKQSAEQSSIALQDKSVSLQTELKELMQASLQRLENNLASENERNQAFVFSLISELQTRTEQMKSKLAALGHAHHENVDFAFDLASQHYLSGLETVKISLEEKSSSHQLSLSTYGSSIMDKITQTTEQNSWQQHEQSTENSNLFFVHAREQEKIISDRAYALNQALLIECQNKFKGSQILADKAAEEVAASIRSLLETVAEHAISVEKDSNSKYAQLTDEHFQKVDVRLSNFADELSNLHDGITDQLTKNTEELANDLLSASTQAQEALRIKCDQSVNSVDTDFNSFKQKLESRLQLSRGQKRTLEEDKNKILIAIKNELLSIHDSFAKKIASLLVSAKSELADMTKSVESKIVSAMETCNEQVGSSAAAAQKQIEDEVASFLTELSNFRSAAVSEITASAQGGLPLVNIPDNQKKPPASSSSQNSTVPVAPEIAPAIVADESELDAFATGLDLQPVILSELLHSPKEGLVNNEIPANKETKKNRRRKLDEHDQKENIEESDKSVIEEP